jgi:XTP/dITP diphosphohydrolase
MPKIIYATTNPGKFAEVQKILAHHDLPIVSPAELGISIEVEEPGATLEENARLKAEAYLHLAPSGSIIIGDDTGVEIDALGGEPGIRVRRWKGYKMTDEEIINYAIERLRGVPANHRGAQFRTVLAVAQTGRPVQYFDGVLRGEILLTPRPERREGMPFWPIFYLPGLKMTLGEFHSQTMDFQLEHPTHRERAVLAALPYLRSLCTSQV